MSDEALPQIFTVPMAGRDISVRRAGLGQVLVLQRLFHRARAKGETDAGEAMSTVVIKTLDFIDTLIVSDEQRQFVEDQMLAGTIDWQEVLSLLSGGKDPGALADDEAPAPPKPRKTAAKRSPRTAAKTVAAAKRGSTKR